VKKERVWWLGTPPTPCLLAKARRRKCNHSVVSFCVSLTHMYLHTHTQRAEAPLRAEHRVKQYTILKKNTGLEEMWFYCVAVTLAFHQHSYESFFTPSLGVYTRVKVTSNAEEDSSAIECILAAYIPDKWIK